MSSAQRVAAYRQRMKDRGYREIRIWVPDTNSEEFRQYCRESAQRMAEADRKEGIMDELEEFAADLPEDDYS
ncbi:antitoxin MazE-like protein [Nesterenkonia ebinurensis]|uniref:antitoxin MazE-like protein n=1 Tax=Nesterenkonia ebinurensis TaxID=2608252 RepID=UPI00123CD411|nr:antitoxin MazE-like protein [Nesterenkonia ebinurensis]